MGRMRRSAARLAVIAAASAGLVVGTVSTASAAPGWFDGLIRYSAITNCFSIIQGTPYVENGAGAYIGYVTDTLAAPPKPAPNTTFYIHVVVYGLGNSCAGQRFVPAISLPTGVSLDATAPIRCVTKFGTATSPSSDCPGFANFVPATYGGQLMYLSTDTANARTWPLPQGGFWEFQFPVKSNRVVSSELMYSFVKMFDGNSNSTLASDVPLYVFGAGGSTPPVQVGYPTPSTYKCSTVDGTGGVPAQFGFCSQTQMMTYGRTGTGSFEIGTAANVYPQSVSFALPADEGWTITTDWNEIGITPPTTPGATYHWRACFTPDGGAKVCGADQVFSQPAATLCDGKVVTVALGLGQQPTAGADVIMGTPKGETIDGRGGNDTICGGGGNDTYRGGTGADRIIGGAGVSTIDFSDLAAGVTVNLTTGVGGGDTFTSIENVIATRFADSITGNTANNTVMGLAGNDTIVGGTGNDSLNGGPGNDKLNGGIGVDTVSYPGTAAVTVNLGLVTAQNTIGAGSDTISLVENLVGSSGNDTLIGSGGANRIVGGKGNDILRGMGGVDTVAYPGSVAVKVSLALTVAQNTLGAGTDTLSTFENLTGSSKNDTLTGNSGNNVLNGSLGVDVCNGGAGTDTGLACETKTGIP